MKDFTPSVLFAIAQETVGAVFWILVALAIAVAVGFVVALIRQRGFRGPAARIAVWSGVIAGVIAAATAPMATQAGFANLNGMLDWILLAVAGLAAMVALAVVVFALLGATRSAAV